MKTKVLGQVWTPEWIVDLILDRLHYDNESTLTKTIMEPSFGEGVFIHKIIERIHQAGLNAGLELSEISAKTDELVYGIEYDEDLYTKTKKALIDKASDLGLSVTLPNVVQGDALDYVPEKKFDFVVGNPPYVRFHHLPEEMRQKVKLYDHSTGNTDLYVVFYELGFSWLNNQGTLGFISPNSWLRNASQKPLRAFLGKEKAVQEIVDFGTQLVFSNASTYTCIALLTKRKTDEVLFTRLDKTGVFLFASKTPSEAISNGEAFVVTNEGDRAFLGLVRARKTLLGDVCKVQNALSTLGDKYFVLPEGTKPLPFSQPAVKGSKYRGEPIVQRMVFPYRKDESTKRYIGVEFEVLPVEIANHLLANREILSGRSNDKGSAWFWYGRSQAIQETDSRKLVVTPVVHPQEPLKTYIVPEGVLVYSGMFITEIPGGLSLEEIKEITESEDFGRYVRLMGKNMGGDYKNLATPLVKQYRF